MNAAGGREPEYAVSAEFYDLLQADGDRRAALRRFAGPARDARLAIVDAGAGTGIVTEVLVGAAAVPVHAVEPSAAMRAGLLARLARLGADERARTTVHAATVAACGLREVADLAVAANLVAVLEPADRRAAFRALARALVPGGVLLFDAPPPAVPEREETWRLGPVRLGADSYCAQVTSTPDRGIVRLCFAYRVERDGVLLREAREDSTSGRSPPPCSGTNWPRRVSNP